MSERYTRLFSLSENLYSTGSPIVISAGVLSKDNQTGKIIVQLKIKNISSKTIKAARVELTTFDTVGQSIAEVVPFEYLDLNVTRDEEFGQKTPILIPENAARSFVVIIKEIIFSDNTIWSGIESEWQPLKQQVKLETVITDKELLKQYRIKYGSCAIYEFTIDKDIWHCVCGKFNHIQEINCCKCGASLRDLENIEVSVLESERDERLKTEAEKDAADKAVKKKQLKILIPVTAALIVIIMIVSIFLHKSSKYNQALELLEQKQYDSAHSLFENLGGYKDSEEYLECFVSVPVEKRGKFSYTTLEYDEYGRLVREYTTGYTDDLFDEERNLIYNDSDGSLTVVYKYTSARINGKNNVVTERTTYDDGNFPTKFGYHYINGNVEYIYGYIYIPKS